MRFNHLRVELVHLDQIIERFKKYFDILGGPATFIQVYIYNIDLESTSMVSQLNTQILLFDCVALGCSSHDS